jgi:hypothetical protein
MLIWKFFERFNFNSRTIFLALSYFLDPFPLSRSHPVKDSITNAISRVAFPIFDLESNVPVPLSPKRFASFQSGMTILIPSIEPQKT